MRYILQALLAVFLIFIAVVVLAIPFLLAFLILNIVWLNFVGLGLGFILMIAFLMWAAENELFEFF